MFLDERKVQVMDVKGIILGDYDLKMQYEYFISLGYGEKASCVLTISNYGMRDTAEFFKSFPEKNILDSVYDYFAESDEKSIRDAIFSKLGKNRNMGFREDAFVGGAMSPASMGMASPMMGQAMVSQAMMSQPMMAQARAASPVMGLAAMAGASSNMASGFMQAPSANGAAMFMKPDPNLIATDSYEVIEEKDAKSVLTSPTSTFRMTTSTASVGMLLNQIRNGRKISMSQVRIEELLNYFDYDKEVWPEKDRKQFKIDTEMMDKGEGRKILYINVQADDTPKEHQNVVLLLDTSGSMSSNKDVTKETIATIISKLKENDVISLITYSSQDHTIFTNHVIGDIKDREDLMGSILKIEINGCTNGSAGIETAYSLGEKTYKDGWSNQVILMTDGDLNFGVTAKDGLRSLIEEKKKTGMFLSVIGTGLYNYKDDKLEILSKYGNGTYCVVNDLEDVKESINKKYVSLTNIVAKDVKAQVEFNPKYVKAYRLLGYENRTLNHEDFRNDDVVSEPYGAGGQGVALYELFMGDATESPSETLKYQKMQPNEYQEIGTVSVRFKNYLSDESEEISEIIPAELSGSRNVKTAYLLYCLSEKLRGSNKLDVDDFKYLASMLNDDKYTELISDKDEVFAKLFEGVKKEALTKKEEKTPTPNPFGGTIYDNSLKPGVNTGMIGMMGMMGTLGTNNAGGQAQSTQEPKEGEWKCICGQVNAGKFCANCGAPRI
ncbi:MAG: von Willebrand factor type A domain-containing protein [Lachnospiraceae bacterium]|nr:von Willebrand factor type A domain-containing protein [Lachnospiraceae bacterium]